MDTECSHGPLTALEEEKKPMEKDSKAHKAVRDVEDSCVLCLVQV